MDEAACLQAAVWTQAGSAVEAFRGASVGYCRWQRSLTVRDPGTALAPDRVRRQFQALGPERLWVADVKQIPTEEGWLYLEVVLDVRSRDVVGSAMRNDARAELVVNALEMVLWRRKPAPGLVHRSDRCC